MTRPSQTVRVGREAKIFHRQLARRCYCCHLHAMGNEPYLYELAAGGHGYGKDNKERAAFIALGLEFLRGKIGWVDGGPSW
jgi:hypothetical protein